MQKPYVPFEDQEAKEEWNSKSMKIWKIELFFCFVFSSFLVFPWSERATAWRPKASCPENKDQPKYLVQDNWKCVKYYPYITNLPLKYGEITDTPALRFQTDSNDSHMGGKASASVVANQTNIQQFFLAPLKLLISESYVILIWGL